MPTSSTRALLFVSSLCVLSCAPVDRGASEDAGRAIGDGGSDVGTLVEAGVRDGAVDSGPGADGGAADDAGATLAEGELWPGGDTTVEVSGVGAFVQEAANLSILERATFEAGLQFFQLAWEVAPGRAEVDGLGPTYNAETCLACHASNGRGVESNPSSIPLHLGSTAGADPVYGGQLQPRAIGGVPAEGRLLRARVPMGTVALAGEEVTLYTVETVLSDLAFGAIDSETRVSPRVAQQLVGMGLLEAIPEAALVALADPDDLDGDGVSGRVARLSDGTVGRFGWKAAQPTTFAQTAAAFAEDLGLTSSLHPNENCTSAQLACAEAVTGGSPELTDARLAAAAAYVRLLGVPARRGATDEVVLRGRELFAAVGCGSCHHRDHVTGPAAEPELAAQHIWPYTDLLLHDLGPGLADGVVEGAAEAAEWRTAPLWSLGRVREVNGELNLLHDGRASSLAEAILWHGGEAAAARDAYASLSAEERAALHTFIESL